MKDEEIIIELYKKLCKASIDKDVKTIDGILSEDYELIHMTGMHQSKEDYMLSVKEGELKYFESVHDSIEVNINGNEATLIGKTKTLASPFGMSASWWRLKQDMKLEKRNDKWVIVKSVASMY